MGYHRVPYPNTDLPGTYEAKELAVFVGTAAKRFADVWFALRPDCM